VVASRSLWGVEGVGDGGDAVGDGGDDCVGGDQRRGLEVGFGFGDEVAVWVEGDGVSDSGLVVVGDGECHCPVGGAVDKGHGELCEHLDEGRAEGRAGVGFSEEFGCQLEDLNVER